MKKESWKDYRRWRLWSILLLKKKKRKERKMEMLTDPCIDQKFDGTKSNSIGPDRYNALIVKHNNALNWEFGTVY